MFRNEHGDPSIVGYVNSYYNGDINYRMSTIWHVFSLTRCPICLKSLAQAIWPG